MFTVFLVLTAGISATVANYVYRSTSETFFDQKAHEKATALQLVDSFVTRYSRFRSQFGQDAPVPATFRAHSIEEFNTRLGTSGALLLRWVGRPGRHIKTAPVAAEMAKTIEELAAAADRKPKSELLTINNQRVMRTVYPSMAAEQSCVNCHNQLQPAGQQWRLNDMMGAFAIDVPVGTFLDAAKFQGYAVALGLFLPLAGVGPAISILHFRQLSERESATAQIRTQNARFNAALNNMTQGLCMFDADKRLVVWNEPYARMYELPPELLKVGTSHKTIIAHRVSSGILAGEKTETATDQKLAARPRIQPKKHRAGSTSSPMGV